MKMETWSRRRVGRQSSQVATTKELERKRRLYKVVMCRMRLGFWRRFGFDAVFHSFAYGYVCMCVYVCVLDCCTW